MTGIIYDLQGHLLLRRTVTTAFANHNLGNRGEISGFSPRSGSRMRRYLRTCAANYRVFVTLLYPAEYPHHGSVCKRHLDVLVKRIARMDSGENDEPLSVFWFLEFQQRGAPHFHLFVNRTIKKEVLAVWWYSIVGSGDEKHLLAGTRIEWIRGGRYATTCYASKYAAKQEQKVVPPSFDLVGRFWGVYGDRRAMSATIYFPAILMESSCFLRFRLDLAAIIKQNRSKIRGTRHHGWSSGLFIKDETVIAAINSLINRTALNLLFLQHHAKTGEFCMMRLFESPLLEVPFENDLSAANRHLSESM
jgi:hypothetical protein